MKVHYGTPIVDEVHAAIRNANESNLSIQYIELTRKEAEMFLFYLVQSGQRYGPHGVTAVADIIDGGHIIYRGVLLEWPVK